MAKKPKHIGMMKYKNKERKIDMKAQEKKMKVSLKDDAFTCLSCNMYVWSKTATTKNYSEVIIVDVIC